MGLLTGKVAFITGAAQGQGRAHALASAREGADVLLVDICEQLDTVPSPMGTEEGLAETVKEIENMGRRAIGMKADVRSQQHLDAAVAAAIMELGQIDILIANAGIIASLAPFWELSDDMWRDELDVNLTGVWRSAKAVAPHMIQRQTGSIVITSSVNGLESGMLRAHYVASKHGVIGLMKNIALELAPHGIRCNSVAPGAVNTAMVNYQAAYDMFAGHPGGTAADVDQAIRHYAALKGTSLMTADLIANATLFLNSELAAGITGVTIPVDAGHLILEGVNQSPVP